MSPLGADNGHYALRPHCGICGRTMGIAERFYLLQADVDSTDFPRRIGPFTFPDHGHYPNKSGVLLCRKPNCRYCARSAESSTIHSDCFDLVKQKCQLDEHLEQLWVMTAWRAPWRCAPDFQLQQMTVAPEFSMLNRLGISRMRLLPQELIHMVHVYSTNSLFWKYSTACEMAQTLPTLSSEQLSIPLCNIAAWERGDRLTTSRTANQLPVVRVTIDSRGIRRIERLSEHPPFQRRQTDSLVFVVMQQRYLEGITAHLKFGYLRLELPSTCHGLQTWDVSTPPLLEKSMFYPDRISSSTQFRTIELSQTTGITFFFCFGKIYAIHAHTRRAPCARSTHQLLSRRCQASVTWVYIPISREDHITSLCSRIINKGSSSDMCLLLRLKLAGDVVVGFTYSEEARYILLSKTPPSTIIYDTAELSPVSVVGAYATERDDDLPMDPFRPPLIDKKPPFPNACFSLSSLEGTSHIRLFNDTDSGFCVGVLLEFDNGAKRSLGQCRIGIDPFEDFEKPIYICFRRQSYTRRGISGSLWATMTTATDLHDHSHGSDDWTCFPMQGELEFWFSQYETRLTVICD